MQKSGLVATFLWLHVKVMTGPSEPHLLIITSRLYSGSKTKQETGQKNATYTRILDPMPPITDSRKLREGKSAK